MRRSLRPVRGVTAALGGMLHGACGAALAALPVVLWDAQSLEDLTIARPIGLGVSALANGVVVLSVALLCGLAARLFGPSLADLAKRWQQDNIGVGASALWWICGVWLLGGISYGVVLACQWLLAGALTALVLPAAIALVGAGWLSSEQRANIFFCTCIEKWRWPAQALALSGLGLLAAVAAMVVIAWPVLAQLSLRPLLCWTVIAAAGLLAAMLPLRPRRRGVKVAVVGLRGLTALVAIVGLVSIGRAATHQLPKRLALALELRATSTAAVGKVWTHRKGYTRRRPKATAARVSASCFPNVPPPALDALQRGGSEVDIVFITVDALRFDHMSLAGYVRDTTPNIARHASDAVVFERAYSLSGTTRQTFRGLFTGVYGSLVHEVRSRNSNWGFGFTDAQLTLAEMLRHAGYETSAYSTQWSIFSLPDGALDGFSEVDESAGDVRVDVGRSTDYMITQVIERLSRPRSANRFVWTHLMTPHHPYPAGPAPIAYGAEQVDEYDAAIHFFDQEMGRLLDYVRAPERAGFTWLIVTADHGEGWWEHGIQGHGPDTYEEFVHVPMLVWGPGVKARRVATRVSQIHLVPTMVELAGITPPEAFCGTSLLSTLRGGPAPASPIYIEVIPDFGRSNFRAVIIEDDLKTSIRPNSGMRELYNLLLDPKEANNLADTQPELLRRQLDLLRRFHRGHGIDPTSYGL